MLPTKHHLLIISNYSYTTRLYGVRQVKIVHRCEQDCTHSQDDKTPLANPDSSFLAPQIHKRFLSAQQQGFSERTHRKTRQRPKNHLVKTLRFATFTEHLHPKNLKILKS